MNLSEATFMRLEADRRADPAGARQAEQDFDAAFEAREQKRLRRLSHLGDLGMAIAEECGRVLIGKPPVCDSKLFAGGNLEAAFNRTARTVLQITLLEDKLEQERRARLARTAEEEKAHQALLLADKARREAARADAVERQASARRKTTVRGAVEMAHEVAAPEMDPMERENLLDELFMAHEGDPLWDEDDAVIVCKFLGQMGFVFKPGETNASDGPGSDRAAPETSDAAPDPDDRSPRPKLQAIAMARGYLDEIAREMAGAANDRGGKTEAARMEAARMEAARMETARMETARMETARMETGCGPPAANTS